MGIGFWGWRFQSQHFLPLKEPNVLALPELYTLEEGASLKPYNTFWIDVKAKYLARVFSVEGLSQLLTRFSKEPLLILGDGSNILLTQDFEGLVIINELKGKEVVEETDQYVDLKVNGGENWHSLVRYAVEQGWGGIENLSLIPGKTGAAPIQNIGAYGVELKDVFVSLEAFHFQSHKVTTFGYEDCKFGYRNSIFKNELKDQYLISSVTLRLSKHPVINTSYGALQKMLDEKGIQNPSIREISDLVSEVRRSKLPYPDELGNAGSFFKNTIVSRTTFEALQARFPKVPSFPAGENQVKIPSAWLIENAGLKGYRHGKVGTHVTQPLVIVNYGRASGNEVLQLAYYIQKVVYDKFGIHLEPEVNII